MSSYIIAGSSDNIDTAYCQQIAKKIKAKYTNIDFRIIIKHPSQWQKHLQEICRIYGFNDKSNPIIYTFDGKIIGNKAKFIANTSKYFGITQKQLQIGKLSTEINKKQADLQLKAKIKLKNQEKTLLQNVDQKLDQLKKSKTLNPKLFNYQKQVTNGLVFLKRQVTGLIENINFPQKKQIQFVKQEIIPSDIDINALTLKDQIPVVEDINHKQKQAFVTNQQQGAELKRQKTNGSGMRMHESAYSHQNQSKHSSIGNKQNKTLNNKTQLQQQQLFEQSRDYDLVNIQNYIANQLGDQFYLVFNRNPIILGQLDLIKSAPTQEGIFQMDYSKHIREVKGHIYKIPVPTVASLEIQQPKISETQIQKKITTKQKLQGEDQQFNQEASIQGQIKGVNKVEQQKMIQANNQYLIHLNQQYEIDYESNINAKSLNFYRPLSKLQIKKTYQVVSKLSAIATIQFKPINPCPKIKIYLRKYLRQATQASNNISELPLPIQLNIIQKLQTSEVILPDDNVVQIRQLGYLNLAVAITNPNSINDILKRILFYFSKLQNKLNKFIGYNLIITKQYLLVVPLLEQYRKYNNKQLYIDGLSYLGIVHLAKVEQQFKIKKYKIQKAYEYLKRCSGTIQ